MLKSSLENGWVKLEPESDIVAGEYGTWKLTYTVGSKGIRRGGKLVIAQRWPCDWGEPQFCSPSSINYLCCEAPCKVKLYYGRRSYHHPWDNALWITIEGRDLREGEKIVILYGDKKFGGLGFRAQTFIEKKHRFLVLVDAEGNGLFKKVHGETTVRIVAGEPKKVIVTIPSTLSLGEEGYIHLRVEDLWGNPCPNYRGKLIISSTDQKAILPKVINFKSRIGAQKFKGIVFKTAGVHKISIEDRGNDLYSESNPVLVTKEHTNFKIFWGDLHGQAKIGCGAGSIEEYFEYEKYIAGVDFGAYQGNDNLITSNDWIRQRNTIEKYNSPGEFVTFHGYEWSDTYDKGGHHNIYFFDDEKEIRRCNHKFIKDKSDIESDVSPISEIYKIFKPKVGKVLIVPHVGGEPANLNFHDKELEKLIEVHSTHGTFEWFIQDALERGYKVGFIAGSDDIMGRPGASKPGYHYARFCENGLCAVYARGLTRADIWEALFTRRTYATTGPRIIVYFTANGHIMGEEFTTDDEIEFRCQVIGTCGLEEVKIIRGIKDIFTYPMPEAKFNGHIRIYWEGAMCKDTGLRSNVKWDGMLDVENGGIENVEGYAFDTPREGISEFSQKCILWRSETSGDRDGIILKLKNFNRKTSFFFESEQIEFKFTLEELEQNRGKLIKYVGPVNRRVVIDYPPTTSINSIDFTFKDDPLENGTYPYYLKVVQVDGSKAWTSPIYITVKK